jgi:type IV pilus assembly protein PilN
MIRINLLPFRADRKKENVRRQVSLFLLSLGLVLIIGFYYNFDLGSKIGKTNDKIKKTNADLAKYNEINKEIARIRQNLEILRKKMAVIEQLETDRHAPVILLDTLTQVVVAKRMWLTELTVAEAKVNRSEENAQQPIAPRNITIAGWAMDDKTVADFMDRLQKCGLFDSEAVKLVQIAKSEDKGSKKAPQIPTNFKRFEINIKPLSPEPAPENKRKPRRT